MFYKKRVLKLTISPFHSCSLKSEQKTGFVNLVFDDTNAGNYARLLEKIHVSLGSPATWAESYSQVCSSVGVASRIDWDRHMFLLLRVR